MKLLSIIFTLAILTTSCVRETERTFDFKPNQITTLRFEIKNCNDFKTYKILFNQTLPWEQVIKSISFKTDTLFTLNLSLNHPLYPVLIDNNMWADFFVIPNDTLDIQLDFGKGNKIKDVISFSGVTSSISNYLVFNRNHFFGGPSKTQSPEDFNQMIDSVYSKEMIILDSIYSKKLLPKWFVNIEKENISSERDNLKFMQYSQRAWMYDDYISKGNEFQKKIDLSNLSNYWLENSISLLSEFKHERFDTLLQQKYVTTEIFYDYMQNNIDELKGKIPESVLSYFVASKISILFNENRLLRLPPDEFNSITKRIDNFIVKNSILIKDTMLLNLIESEKSRKFSDYKNQHLLKIGDKAPNFFLEDINGEKVELTNFKGKVVYLNFWGTSCAPCIKSIPDKNRIVNEYKNEDFVLINICLDSNYKGWKEIIENNNFAGIHLFGKGNWREILNQKYNIYTIPHYTIIDKNGFVIKNGVRDSTNYYIKKNI